MNERYAVILVQRGIAKLMRTLSTQDKAQALATHALETCDLVDVIVQAYIMPVPDNMTRSEILRAFDYDENHPRTRVTYGE